jgi:toxoflavin biosynthesis protein ToxD
MNGHVLIEIPAGMSCLGSDIHDPYASERERPLREVYISAFRISKYPTIRAQFAEYIHATNGGFSSDWGPLDGRGWPQSLEVEGDLPMVTISWDLALRYCSWLSAKTGKQVDLPTEAEWEKAARGGNDRLWPWGNEFDSSLCSSAENGLDSLVTVYEYEKGGSPFGVMHMSGLVWEWCLDFYDPNSHLNARFVNPVNLVPAAQRVVKGGSAYCTKEIVRPAGRDWTNSVNQGGGDDGFRIIVRM